MDYKSPGRESDTSQPPLEPEEHPHGSDEVPAAPTHIPGTPRHHGIEHRSKHGHPAGAPGATHPETGEQLTAAAASKKGVHPHHHGPPGAPGGAGAHERDGEEHHQNMHHWDESEAKGHHRHGHGLGPHDSAATGHPAPAHHHRSGAQHGQDPHELGGFGGEHSGGITPKNAHHHGPQGAIHEEQHGPAAHEHLGETPGASEGNETTATTTTGAEVGQEEQVGHRRHHHRQKKNKIVVEPEEATKIIEELKSEHPAEFSKLAGEDEVDEEEAQLVKLITRKQKKTAAAVAARATGTKSGFVDALKQLTATKVKEQHSRVCQNRFVFIFILAVVGAMGVLLTFSIYNLVQNPMNQYLWPPTDQGSFTTGRMYSTCISMSVLGFVGFAIIQGKVTSLLAGLLYMFLLICICYLAASAFSHAYYSYHYESFHDVINHSVRSYVENNLQLPKYVVEYQKLKKCCGWGPFYWTTWPSELNLTLVPESCCVNPYIGCGDNLLSGRPSGYLAKLEHSQYLILQERWMNRGWGEIQDLANAKLSSTFRIPRNSKFTVSNVPSSEVLRSMDEIFALKYYTQPLTIPPPLPETIAPDRTIITYELNDRPEIPIRIFPRGDPSNTTAVPEEALMYFSRGLEEAGRVLQYVHGKPCEVANTITRRRGIHEGKDLNMMASVQVLMRWIMLYSVCLFGMALLLAAIFWLYFSRVTARALAEKDLPKDFQDLDIEQANFGDEELNAHEVEKLRERQEKLQLKKEEKKQQLALALALSERRKKEHEERQRRRRALHLHHAHKLKKTDADGNEIESSSSSSGEREQGKTETDAETEADDTELETEEVIEENLDPKRLKRTKKSVRFGGGEDEDAQQQTPKGKAAKGKKQAAASKSKADDKTKKKGKKEVETKDKKKGVKKGEDEGGTKGRKGKAAEKAAAAKSKKKLGKNKVAPAKGTKVAASVEEKADEADEPGADEEEAVDEGEADKGEDEADADTVADPDEPEDTEAQPEPSEPNESAEPDQDA